MAMIDTFLDPETVSRLVAAYGGSCLLVPAKQRGKSWEQLVADIGEDFARLVQKSFQGESLAIPTADNERVRETVISLRERGVSVREITKLTFPTRYSERQIYRMLAEHSRAA